MSPRPALRAHAANLSPDPATPVPVSVTTTPGKAVARRGGHALFLSNFPRFIGRLLSEPRLGSRVPRPHPPWSSTAPPWGAVRRQPDGTTSSLSGLLSSGMLLYDLNSSLYK
eukprot:6559743-Prymnesium_polylepis.1